MAGPPHTEQVDEQKGRKKSITRPLGLKLYIGLYVIGWLAILILLASADSPMLIYSPIPIVGLVLLYYLWELRYWAWAATLFIHFLDFLYTFSNFLANDIGVPRFGTRTILTIVFATYLYMNKGYFE